MDCCRVYTAQAEALIAFLQQCRWLWDCHISDVVAKKTWKSAPEHWLEALAPLSPDELLACLAGAIPPSWPSDLRDWLQSTQQLAVPRDRQSQWPCICSLRLQEQLPGCAQAHSYGRCCSCSDAPALTSQAPQQQVLHAPRCLPVGINPKKQHEIEAVAALVAGLVGDLGADLVMDIGMAAACHPVNLR